MDQPNGVGRLGVGDEDDDGAELSDGDVSALTVIVAVILVGQRVPLEDGRKIHEIDAVLVQIGSALCLVPQESLPQSVAPYCSYDNSVISDRISRFDFMVLRIFGLKKHPSASSIHTAREGVPVPNGLIKGKSILLETNKERVSGVVPRPHLSSRKLPRPDQ